MRHTKKTRWRVQKLIQLLQGAPHLLIIMQDNPDPDAIAAAVALRKFAHSVADVPCSITHGGTLGRGENRALVGYLGLNLRPCEGIEFEKFHLIAMVDTQPGTGNNCLPANVVPDVVIDHHPFRRATRAAQFFDIRRGYGATTTILLEYLIEAGITPDIPLATALLYGIRSDTQDLGREASQADIEAIATLFPLANKRMLGEIQRGSVERVYFRMLAEGLRNARVYGNCIITGLGDIDNPDMIGEVADLLLRDEKIFWTMCYGFCQDKMMISIRTCELDGRADKIIRYVVGRKGTSGGHETYAGGQISLRSETKSERARLEKMIRQRFLRTIGVETEYADKLIG